MDLKERELNNDEIDIVHDTICNALDNVDLTRLQVLEYWNKLPDYIKLNCLIYGADDTPTRESMYVWFKENCK